jgi:outer membrane protein
MNKHLYISTALIALTGAVFSSAATAKSVEGKDWDAKERFMIRVRAIDVVPDADENSSTSIGGNISAEDQIVPEVDFTYFFTDNIAAELIAAVTPHQMGADNTALGNLNFGDVWLLPPTLTAQYHFNPHGQFRPYVGAGINYTYYFNEDHGDVNDVDYESGFGYAFQAGMDYALDEHWALNADVKKVYHNVDAKVNGGAVTADVDLDPWIFGVGVGYRF